MSTDYIQYRLNQPKRASSQDLSDTTCPVKTANCESLSDPKEQKQCRGEMVSRAGDIAKQMGVTACQSSGGRSKTVTEVDIGLGLLASGSGETTTSQYSSLGCETLSVISKEMNIATEKVACSLNKSSATISKNFSAGNSIEISADGGEVLIDCSGDNVSDDGSGFKIDQNIVLKIVSMDQLTDSDISDISNTVDASINSIADAIANSVQGVAAPPPSSKQVLDSVMNVKQSDNKTKIIENVKKISMAVDTSNRIRIAAKNGGKITIKGKKCNLSQSILLDIVANNIVSSSVSDAFKDVFKIMAEDKTAVSNLSKTLGEESAPQTSKMMKYVMYFFAFLLLGGIVYYAVSQ